MGNRMEQKSVVVTGGSKGLGRGIAQVFAREGAKVLVVARQPDAGEQTATEIVDAGGTASFFRADISNWDDVEAMVKAAIDRHGGIDILCSNAGIFPSVRLEEMTQEEWDSVNSVNLKGTFLAVKACLPELKKTDGGRIPPDIFHHRADYRVSRLGALRRDKSRYAGIHAHGGNRVREVQHHDQCRNAREYHDRRLGRRRSGLPTPHGEVHTHGQIRGPRGYRLRYALPGVPRSKIYHRPDAGR